MKISFLSKGVVIAAALCLAPAALLASPKAAGQDTVIVNPEASPGETSSRFEQIRSDAISVQDQADHLQALLGEGSLAGWEGDASLLGEVRDQVNEMSKLVYDLRVHQAEASPLQQAIIEQIAPPTYELVGTTQDALVALNNNKSCPFMSDLPTLVNDMSNEASRVARTAGDFKKYLHSHQEEQQLKQTLGL